MQNKNNTKTKLYVLIALLLVLCGMTFAIAKNGALQGLFPGREIEITLGTDPLESAENAANNAETQRDLAESYSGQAVAAAEDADAAFDEQDEDALYTAQDAASEAATNAETAAANAQSYAENASTAYSNAEADAEELRAEADAKGEELVASNEAHLDAEDELDAAEAAEASAEAAYTACLAQPTCLSQLATKYQDWLDAVETLDSATANEAATLSAWERDRDEYEAAYTEAEAAEDTRDAVEAYMTQAQGFADEANTFAVTAREAADAAAEYSVLICTDLTLDPSTYEMAASDTEASFDLTVTIETGEQGSDIDMSDWEIIPVTNNLLNAVISIPSTRPTGLFGSGSSTEYWNGTLVLEADGYGEFTYDGRTDNPLEIDLEEAGSITVSFAGGQEGDEISAYIDGEELRCISRLTLTQATDTTTDVDSGSHGSLDEIDTTLDTDGDGLTDVDEETYETDANDSDSDDDGVSDGSEVSYGTDPNDDDTDSDGLSDYTEIFTTLTDPSDSDTDNDNYTDGAEQTAGTDPLDSTNYPGSSSASSTTTTTSDDDDDDDNDEVPTLTRDIILEDYTCTDSFVDTKGEWFEDMVCRAKEAGWVKGYSSYVFGPSGNITRAEWTKILTKIYGLDEDDGWDMPVDFLDVTKTEDWSYPFIALALDKDWIRTRDAGYYFRPDDPITRADAILWAVRAAGEGTFDYDIERVFFDVENSDYFAYALYIASQTEVDTAEEDNVPVIEGYDNGTYKPYNYIARSEAVAIAIRASLAWGVASEDWDE